MEHAINLTRCPVILQTGLCIHGTRRKETLRLRGLWALHAYRYSGQLEIRGETREFHPGCVSLVPPDEPVCWEFPAHAPHYYAHFSVPRGGGYLVPVVRALGEAFDSLCGRFEEMIQWFPCDPERAAVRLWDMLFQIARAGEPDRSPSPALHPSLQIALSIITNSLDRKIAVGAMAREMGISHTHLNTLFKRQFACTVHEFIHRRRVERALHLLTRSSLTIKSIAAETGFPNLQQFNKAVRRAAGSSPRACRQKNHP